MLLLLPDQAEQKKRHGDKRSTKSPQLQVDLHGPNDFVEDQQHVVDRQQEKAPRSREEMMQPARQGFAIWIAAALVALLAPAAYAAEVRFESVADGVYAFIGELGAPRATKT